MIHLIQHTAIYTQKLRQVTDMGMYTRLYLTCNLDKADDTDMAILARMADGTANQDMIPSSKQHKLFETESWSFMLRCNSAYFDHVANSRVVNNEFDGKILVADCNLKNYSGEIEAFLDWVKPLSTTRGFVGFYQYEEAEEPTLIYW